MNTRTNLTLVLLALFIAAAAQQATAQTNVFAAQWKFADFTQSPQGIRSVYITPQAGTPAVWGSNTITFDRKAYRADSSGSLVVSNMIPGVYLVEFQGFYKTTTYTNYFDTNCVGLVNASGYLAVSTNLPGNVYAYSTGAADAKFATWAAVNSATNTGLPIRGGANISATVVTGTNVIAVTGPLTATYLDGTAQGQVASVAGPMIASILGNYNNYYGIFNGNGNLVTNIVGTNVSIVFTGSFTETTNSAGQRTVNIVGGGGAATNVYLGPGPAVSITTNVAGSIYTINGATNYTGVQTFSNAASVFYGIHAGDASRLTSIPAAGISGTVANATHATSADTATSATSAGSATSATTAGTATVAVGVTATGTAMSTNELRPVFIGSGTLSNATMLGTTSVSNATALSMTVSTLYGNGSGLTNIPSTGVNGIVGGFATNTGQGTITYSGAPIYWTPGAYGDLSTAYGAFKFPQVGGTNYPNLDSALAVASPTTPCFVPDGTWPMTNQVTWPVAVIGRGPATILLNYVAAYNLASTTRFAFLVTNNLYLSDMTIQNAYDTNAGYTSYLCGGETSGTLQARVSTNVVLRRIFGNLGNGGLILHAASAGGSAILVEGCNLVNSNNTPLIQASATAQTETLSLVNNQLWSNYASVYSGGTVYLSVRSRGNVYGGASTNLWLASGVGSSGNSTLLQYDSFTNTAGNNVVWVNAGGASSTHGWFVAQGCFAPPAGIHWNTNRLMFNVQFSDYMGTNYSWAASNTVSFWP